MNKNEFEILKKNLPSRPGIQGREKYFNSAVLVPLVLLNDEYHLLFQKRASSVSQGNEICFPGGKHEPELDSGFQETAIRETCEELGIGTGDIDVIGQLDTIVAPMGATVDAFLGILDGAVVDRMTLDGNEVEEVFTIPVSHFRRTGVETYSVRIEIQPSFTDKHGEHITLLPSRELGLPEKYQRPWGGKRHRVLVYNSNHGLVWGITAEIIFDLIQKLEPGKGPADTEP